MLTDDLSLITSKMVSYTERAAADLDLRYYEQIVLLYINGKGSCNQEQIARQFEVDKSMVSKTMAKLEKRGVVSRRTNADNKREYIISLTPEGHALVPAVKAIFAAWDEKVYAGLTPDDRARIERTVAHMLQNADALLAEED